MMPRECFIPREFAASSMEIIDQANAIIDEYEAQGFTLTLRQLYYQFVARDLVRNTQQEYKRIGSIINDARLAGYVDWNAIEDRTRHLRANPHWESPESIVRSCASQFAYDKWEDQPCRIEVWIEKDALLGVIEPACRELDVPYFACRGYSSQSEQWRAGKRMSRHIADGQDVIVLHLGDHDPSGMDMTRDNDDRLSMFSGESTEVRRIALNKDQIDQYRPPPNPAKLTDSRAKAYILRFGESSWELDALEPGVIDRLVRDQVLALRDDDAWDAAVAREHEAREDLGLLASKWEDVISSLRPTEPGA